MIITTVVPPSPPPKPQCGVWVILFKSIDQKSNVLRCTWEHIKRETDENADNIYENINGEELHGDFECEEN